MTAYGEPAWPPAGNNPGRHRGDPLTATGENSVAVDSFEKLAVRYEATVTISMIDIWLRHLERHLRNTA